MSAGLRPMEIQSATPRDELTQYPIPAQPRARPAVTSGVILSSRSKPVVVERLRTRSKTPAPDDVQKLADA